MKLVWDFGNVVFHWQPPALLRRELPQHASDVASAERWAQTFFQGYEGDWAEFDRGVLSTPEIVQRIASRTGLDAIDVRRVVDAVPTALQPPPAMVALLRRLHAAGTPLYYLSNMPADYARRLQAEHDFLSCFSDGIFSSHIQLVKPQRELFKLAAQRFAAAPAELLLIDDHLPNIEAARAAGWQGHLYTGAADAEAHLRALGLVGD